MSSVIKIENLTKYYGKVKALSSLNLDVDENSILVLKNCGPKVYPGMAEVGNMILPQKLLKKGIRDINILDITRYGSEKNFNNFRH